METKSKSLKSVITVGVVTGLLSGLMVLALFIFIYPTAWFFFIIPAVMGTCIYKYAKVPFYEDEEENEKLAKKVGLLCAGMSLLFILFPVALIAIVASYSFGELLANVPFLIMCALAVWYGYNRGQRAVVDANSDAIVNSLSDKNNDRM